MVNFYVFPKSPLRVTAILIFQICFKMSLVGVPWGEGTKLLSKRSFRGFKPSKLAFLAVFPYFPIQNISKKVFTQKSRSLLSFLPLSDLKPMFFLKPMTSLSITNIVKMTSPHDFLVSNMYYRDSIERDY